ncbi:MAG: PilZ domain-containing protein [Phycisphaeraceae bacterium]
MSKRTRWNESVGRKPIDTLRLTDAQWLECLAEIKHVRETQAAIHAKSRAHERRDCDLALLMLANMFCSDGRRQLYTIRTFDISAVGMGFLHGSYVYVDTRLELLLKHREDGWKKISGKVMRCDYFKNMVHQIGVIFDEELNLEDYILTESGLGPEELNAA